MAEEGTLTVVGFSEDQFHSPIYCILADEVVNENRIRAHAGEIADFARKLKDEGQQNAITVEFIDGKPHLNTGERRLLAAQLLSTKNEFIGMTLPEGNPRRVKGPGYILARDVGALNDIERLVLEISENMNRKEFTKAEEALGIARLRALMQKDEGRVIKISELAEKLKTSVGQVGMAVKIAESVEADPTSELSKRILKAPSIKAGYEVLQTTNKLNALKHRAAQQKPIPEEVKKAMGYPDGIAFLKGLSNESVDFVHFDPPWGVGVDEYDRRNKHENFDDSPEYAWKSVIEPMVPELYRVLKTDTWSVVWFGIQYYERLKSLLTKVGFTVDPVPGIWYKTNKGGSQNNPDLVELNVYEPFFRIKKGDPRLFKKAVKNVIEADMVPTSERIHFAEKSDAVCQELLERYTFGQMTVIDPTYGSGRVLRMAKKLGRRFAGAEKNEVNRSKAIELMRDV